MKLIAALILPALLFAQPAKVTRVIEYEPDGTDQMKRFEPLLVQLDVAMRSEPLLGLVSLQGLNKESVDEAEKLIRKYYKPRPAKTAPARNVEFTLRVLRGRTGVEPSDIPATLNEIVTQIKQTTALTSLALVESQIIRAHDGAKIESAGILNWDAVETLPFPPYYTFTSNFTFVGNAIRLDNLSFKARVPSSLTNASEASIHTSVDLIPGRQVVIGKANASFKDGAIILVLSAKIVD